MLAQGTYSYRTEGQMEGQTDGRMDRRNDGKPKAMSLRFSSKRRGTIKVCEYSRLRSFHDDLILQDQASGERSQDQWSSGMSIL